MSKLTPREWHAVLETFNPAETREAIALLAESPGLQVVLRAAKGIAGERAEQQRDSGGSTPRKMISKMASRCVRCGRGISVGIPIFWLRGVGAWHEGCER